MTHQYLHLEPQQPFINGCFNWMIPNLYIGNGCFTNHPFLNGCLGFQAAMNSISPWCGGASRHPASPWWWHWWVHSSHRACLQHVDVHLRSWNKSSTNTSHMTPPQSIHIPCRLCRLEDRLAFPFDKNGPLFRWHVNFRKGTNDSLPPRNDRIKWTSIKITTTPRPPYIQSRPPFFLEESLSIKTLVACFRKTMKN